MKTAFTISIICTAFFLFGVGLYAQDSSKTSAMHHIKSSSEKTDNLQAKKIQQQSLLNNKVEKLDSVTAVKPAKKKKINSKHKH